jgi:hypothetical protein
MWQSKTMKDPTQPAQEQAKEQIRRLRDLPESERKPFAEWLYGSHHYIPLIQGAPNNEQDGYWLSDYNEWKGATPTHAPSEGQTGETPETDAAARSFEWWRDCHETNPQDKLVEKSICAQLEAQRDEARKERDALKASENDQLAAIEDLTADIRPDEDSPGVSGTVVERVQSLLATNSQLAAMRQKFISIRDYEHQDGEAAVRAQLIAKEALVSTSGQALLDRLRKAEEDSKMLDWLEKWIPKTDGMITEPDPDCDGWRLVGAASKPCGQGPTLRTAIASAMRKDGHE